MPGAWEQILSKWRKVPRVERCVKGVGAQDTEPVTASWDSQRVVCVSPKHRYFADTTIAIEIVFQQAIEAKVRLGGSSESSDLDCLTACGDGSRKILEGGEHRLLAPLRLLLKVRTCPEKGHS